MHFIKIEIKYNDFFPLIIINFLGIKIKLKNKSRLFKKKPVICDNDKTLLIFDHALGGGTETFSYTTAEAINLGYPVMCFDMGGQADQVKNYKKGIITSQNAADIYKNIIKYAEREKIS